jgi:hypothetical protein
MAHTIVCHTGVREKEKMFEIQRSIPNISRNIAGNFVWQLAVRGKRYFYVIILTVEKRSDI